MRIIPKLLVLLCFVGISLASTRATAQTTQAPTQTYSSSWEPVSATQIQTLVHRNANNGLGLDQLWWRANLYGRTSDFMTALRDVVRTQSDNSIAMAFYARSALDWRAAFINSSTSQTVPAQIERDFGLSVASIRAMLDKATQLNARNWIALLSKSDVNLYSGVGSYPLSVDEVKYSRQALSISDNPWTNVVFANALMSDAAYYQTKNPKRLAHRAVELLNRSRRKFPNYPRTDVALFQFYAYWPLTKNLVEARKAEQRLIASINPSLRQTAPIQRYLKSIRLA